MAREKIVIEAVVNRKRGEVWALWNEPEHIRRWNFASADWCCPRAENDLQLGGRLLSRFEAEEKNSAELQRTGWQAILDNFKQYAEACPL